MPNLTYEAAFVAAGLCSFACTPVARRLAFRIGAIDRPGGRKIHASPTPRAGGLAVYTGFVVAMLGAEYFRNDTAEFGRFSNMLPLLLSATAIMLLGIVDDCYSLPSLVKLGLEILIAGANVAAGYSLDFFGPWVTVPISIFWLVAIPNAVNLIDGLDGLATGIGLIASLSLLAVSIHIGAPDSAVALAALAGSLLGFLWFNSHPAKIFLGDSGSLFIGFVLAFNTVRPQQSRTGVALLGSLVALGVPVTELTVTTLRRLLRAVRVGASGEPARYRFIFVASPALFSPDSDHIHHRLLTLGFAQRKAVLVLYAISVVLGCTAFLAKAEWNYVAVAFVSGLALFTAIHVMGYRELRFLRNGLFLPIADQIANSSTGILVLYDLFIAAGALLAAFWMCNGIAGFHEAPYFSFLLVLGVQVCALAASGVYRCCYGTKAVGIAEVLALLRAALFAAIAGSTVAYSSAASFELPVIAIDAFVFVTAIVGIRLAFVTLDYIFRQERDLESGLAVESFVTDSGIGTSGSNLQPSIERRPSMHQSA